MGRPVIVVMLVALSGCAAAPLPGWKTSAGIGDCEQHRGLVVADADGQLRDVDHPRELVPHWPAEGPDPGALQLVRGQGGWWVANKGWPGRHSGTRPGGLLWLGDGEREFEMVNRGSYVGVFEHGGETFAVRGDCDPIGVAILERIESTGDGGWAAPVELRRFGGLCPSHATGDHDGRPLVIGHDQVADELALFRIEDERLRQLAVISNLPYDIELPDQLAWTPDGDLLLSSGWWVWNTGPTSEQMDEHMPRARVLDRIDDDRFVAGHLVRGCRTSPLARRGPELSPERALGVIVYPANSSTPGDKTVVMVLPDYARLDRVVDFVAGLTGPVRLEFRGVVPREPDELLRLPANVELTLEYAVSEAELERLRTARPKLFDDAGNWSIPNDWPSRPKSTFQSAQ